MSCEEKEKQNKKQKYVFFQGYCAVRPLATILLSILFEIFNQMSVKFSIKNVFSVSLIYTTYNLMFYVSS